MGKAIIALLASKTATLQPIGGYCSSEIRWCLEVKEEAVSFVVEESVFFFEIFLEFALLLLLLVEADVENKYQANKACSEKKQMQIIAKPRGLSLELRRRTFLFTRLFANYWHTRNSIKISPISCKLELHLFVLYFKSNKISIEGIRPSLQSCSFQLRQKTN